MTMFTCFLNIGNNWRTEPQQELFFQFYGTDHTACWKDICRLCETDNRTTPRMTKVTHTAVFPKALQRLSEPLVCKVFDDKTGAALQAVTDNLEFEPCTVEFVKMITSVSKWWTSSIEMTDVNHGRLTATVSKSRSPWAMLSVGVIGMLQEKDVASWPRSLPTSLW